MRGARPRSATRLLSALLPALATLALGACGEPGPAPRSVLLVTLDTTRPDVLGAWGGPPGATPTLDALARESVVYDAAFSVAPLTQPAHASMLTGLTPPRHGVRMNGTGRLASEARTLAELARDAGYRTGAFVGALVLDPAFGLDQGFEHYGAPRRTPGSTDSHIDDRPAGEVVDEALAWLAEAPERPFLAWVHLFDPHGPYEPPERFRLGRTPRTLYQGEVAYVDRQLARLFGPLLARGADAPWIVVVADHGEAFGEHGEQTHGVFCYDTTLRVPLLVRHPDGQRAGERSDEIVSVVDVFPTLAEALGVASETVPAGGDGVSLLGRVPEGRGVYFESYQGYLAYGTSPLSGWLDARGKYVHSSAPELFDWKADPAEAHDLARERPEVLESYRVALAELAARPRLAPGTSDAAQALGESLQALGYAAAGGSAHELPDPIGPIGSAAASGTNADWSRPSPHAFTDAIRDSLEGQELANQGRLEEAEALLRGTLARMPDNWFAMDQLATVLMRREAFAEAASLLRRVVADGPGWPGSQFNLGASLVALQRPEEALEPLHRAVAARPSEALFRTLLAQTLRELGRDGEAEALEAEGGD